MEVTKNQIDDLNIELTIALKADDYADAERKSLAVYKRKADFKGFRKGMAPISLVKRIYGEQALYEAINGIVAEQLDKFIKDNNLKVLGEPLPSENQKENDWKDGADFEFKFDIGLSPELNFEVDESDKFTYYDIEISDKEKADAKADLLRQHGDFQECEKAGEDDLLTVDLRQGEKSVEGAYVSIRSVADSQKSLFVGVKADDKFTVNVNEAFANEVDRANLLKVKKEDLSGMEPEWEVTVVNVKTFAPAEENQETYDKIFGQGVVTTPEEFEVRIIERLQNSHKQDSDYKLNQDIREYYVNKAGISLPDAFLKRWLLENNKEKVTKEDVDKEFEGFAKDFKWQLVRGYILKKFDVKINDKDLLDAAKGYAAYQYAMYGMGNLSEEILKDAAHHFLQDERHSRNIEEFVENDKAVAAVKEHATLEGKKISFEKFGKLK
ncbi:MAG: trigger factor [Bacteroidales bacterium]|nr:trigger factor [Bacteroidales bacterium]MDY6000904.1 trigger factor [Candidatus Cryptobacteroides sp.]